MNHHHTIKVSKRVGRGLVYECQIERGITYHPTGPSWIEYHIRSRMPQAVFWTDSRGQVHRDKGYAYMEYHDPNSCAPLSLRVVERWRHGHRQTQEVLR